RSLLVCEVPRRGARLRGTGRYVPRGGYFHFGARPQSSSTLAEVTQVHHVVPAKGPGDQASLQEIPASLSSCSGAVQVGRVRLGDQFRVRTGERSPDSSAYLPHLLLPHANALRLGYVSPVSFDCAGRRLGARFLLHRGQLRPTVGLRSIGESRLLCGKLP